MFIISICKMGATLEILQQNQVRQLLGKGHRLLFIIMVKEKSNRKHLVIFCILIGVTSCTYMYKENISDILCVRDASVIALKRYESHAIGEWYIIESYILSDITAQKLMTKMNITLCDMENHPVLKDCYWIGWHPLSVHLVTNTGILFINKIRIGTAGTMSIRIIPCKKRY